LVALAGQWLTRGLAPPFSGRQAAINQAVARTLSLVEPSLKNLDIHIEVIEKHDTELNGHANEYSQVLLNILNNCRDAFEERNDDRQRVITIAYLLQLSLITATIRLSDLRGS
jgi:C4-dicarboxylate-specific signal transduction histidine kinase